VSQEPEEEAGRGKLQHVTGRTAGFCWFCSSEVMCRRTKRLLRIMNTQEVLQYVQVKQLRGALGAIHVLKGAELES